MTLDVARMQNNNNKNKLVASSKSGLMGDILQSIQPFLYGVYCTVSPLDNLSSHGAVVVEIIHEWGGELAQMVRAHGK